MAEDARYLLKSEALPGGGLTVLRFDGEEEISRLFEMRIELLSDDAGIDGADVLGSPATLDLGESTFRGPRRFHGVLSRFAFTGTTADGRFLYAATLHPRLWLLSRTRRSRIFATEEQMTVQQIVTAVLEADLRLTSDDYEWRLTADYPKREHVVQYAETDLAFVSRLLEHWGIAYFIEHRGPRDRLVLTDGNVGFFTEASYDSEDSGGRQGDAHVAPFRPGAGMAAADEPAVYALACRQDLPERQATVKDYNYRLSHVTLQAQSPVVDAGVGLLSDYGDNFKSPEEGVALARIRIEEANCLSTVFEGTSNLKALRSGLLFPVVGHPHARCNGRHLFVVIRHEGGDKVAGVSGLGGDERSATSYRNSFEAIPGDTPFRPARTTPRPRIHGVTHAFIDAAGEGERAEIDEQGQYKVVLPFDVAGKPAGKASRWIRMAQPYGGAGHGFHFPLLKGTEVLVTFIDGDPDRPIISGVVANPQHPSVVTSRNAHRNVLRSVSGVEMEFNDGAAAKEGDGSDDHALAPQRAAEGPPALLRQGQAEGEDTAAGDDTAPADGGGEEPDDSDFAEKEGEEEKWAKITVPDYEETNTSYVRLGSPDSEWEISANLPGIDKFMSYDDEKAEAGWLDYTDGGRFTYTGGNYESLIAGESIQRVTKSGEDLKYSSVREGLLGWHEIECGFVSKSEYSWGDKEEYFAGYAFEASAALTFEVYVGFKLEIALASLTEVNIGTKTEANAQAVFEYNKLEHYSVAKEREIFAAEKIVLSVDHGAKDAADIPFTKGPVIGGTALALVSGAVIGSVFTAVAGADQKGNIADPILTNAGIGIAAGATLAATTVALYAAKKAHKMGHAINATAPAIEIGEHDITLTVGTTSITINSTGIEMKVGATTKMTLGGYAIDMEWKPVQGNKGWLSCSNYLEMQGPRVGIYSDLDMKIDAAQTMNLQISDAKKLTMTAASTNVTGANNFGQ